MKYVTVNAYKSSGEGVSLAGVTDQALASLIARAEARVDRYCQVDTLAPTTISDEQHPWDGQSRRVYPDCWPLPITAVTGLRLVIAGATSALDPASDIAIDQSAGRIEVINFSSLLTPLMLIVRSEEAYLHLDYTAGYTFTDSETLVDSGDHRTYASTRCLWDSGVAAVVAVNGAVVTSGYSVDYTEGTVAFTSPNGSHDVVTASYTYHIPDAVRAATVLVTSMLLGERALQAAGLTNLERARGGRMYEAQRARDQTGPQLPDEAAALLTKFVSPNLAGA